MPEPLHHVTFRCPTCGAAVAVTVGSEPTACASCSTPIATDYGILDFVTEGRSAGERSHYDGYYAARRRVAPTPLQLDTLGPRWLGRDAPPERRSARRRMGDLRGKDILLLGNGESMPELYFLVDEPASLVYSDLSPQGLRNIRDGFAFGDGRRGALIFAAIDAFRLPFFDESVDLVWGFAFVHHLDRLDAFLAEIARVLRPGGRCVFVDDAYSPLWQWLKLGILRPLMRISHNRDPRSPEDLHVAMRGGFREDELAPQISAVGGLPWFERQQLLSYMWHRATVSLFPSELKLLARHRAIARALVRVDERLGRLAPIRRQLIRLIWGFDKPRAPRQQAEIRRDGSRRRDVEGTRGGV